MFETTARGLPAVNGGHTLYEILSQPSCWKDSLSDPSESEKLENIARQFAGYGEKAGASSSAFADRIIHHLGA